MKKYVLLKTLKKKRQGTMPSKSISSPLIVALLKSQRSDSDGRRNKVKDAKDDPNKEPKAWFASFRTKPKQYIDQLLQQSQNLNDFLFEDNAARVCWCHHRNDYQHD